MIDDIKDPSGEDKSLNTTRPEPPEHPLREVHPESEVRGGSQSESQEDDD